MTAGAAVAAAVWLGAGAAGAVIVREDARARRIPNRALAALAALGAAGWLAAAAAGADRAWHLAALANAAAAAAGGLGLWRAGVWPAGDAKLFILLGWLLPLAAPGSALAGPRLTLAFLMNVFVPAGGVFLAAGLAWLWHSRLRHDAGFLRQLGPSYLRGYLRERGRVAAEAVPALARARWAALRADPAGAAAAAADAAAMAAAGASALRLAPLPPGPWTALAFFVVWDAAARAGGRRAAWAAAAALAAAAARAGEPGLAGDAARWLAFGAALSAGRAAAAALVGAQERVLPAAWLLGPLVGLAPLALGGASALGAWVWWGAAGGAAYWFVCVFLEEASFALPPERFAPGLVPAEASWRALASDPAFLSRHFARRYPDGLTARQARALRGWARRAGVAELRFKATRPFAPWIFAGGALTALLQRDVLSALWAWGGR